MPQPVPARVQSPMAPTLHLPARMASTICPLLTVLQLQICASSGSSRTASASAAMSAPFISRSRAGFVSGALLLNRLMRRPPVSCAPSSTAPANLLSRSTSFL